jgi:toxin ParE1/3/4
LEASEATATRLLDRIKDACQSLCHFPLAGIAREQFATGLRAGFAGNYVIYYRHNEQELMIVRVLHAARDNAALAGHGGFAEGRTSP